MKGWGDKFVLNKYHSSFFFFFLLLANSSIWPFDITIFRKATLHRETVTVSLVKPQIQSPSIGNYLFWTDGIFRSCSNYVHFTINAWIITTNTLSHLFRSLGSSTFPKVVGLWNEYSLDESNYGRHFDLKNLACLKIYKFEVYHTNKDSFQFKTQLSLKYQQIIASLAKI